MSRQSDHPAPTRDDGRPSGWTVQYVESARRQVAFTIGLHDRGLPELLVTGLAPRQAGWLLNTFAKRALMGRRPAPGDRVSLPAGTRVELVRVEHPNAHLGMAVKGSEVGTVQLVWADDRGRWPWAPGFDDGVRLQPVLGVRTQNA
jgi:hypothetical protein